MAKVTVSADLRRLVIQRAQGCCEYCRCQERFAMQSFSVEHIIPRQLVTVEAMHLNREGLVNLRKVLFDVGEHPQPVSPLPGPIS